MTPEPVNLTIGEIADRLRVRRQSVQWYLRGVAADTAKIVSGKEASAWSFDNLPLPLMEKLEAAAREQGFRNARTMMACALVQRPQWQPPLPLTEIAESEIEQAVKLRDALAPWFRRRHNDTITSAELEEQCGREYARIFGNVVSGRHIRALISRTVERDGGRNEFERVELYLCERPAKKTVPEISTEEAEDVLGIAEVLLASKNPAQLSRMEQNAIWRAAVDYHNDLLREGVPAKQAARAVRQLLRKQVPQLARSPEALAKGLQRKIAEVAERGRPMDLRKKNGNHFEPPKVDVDLLRHSASFKNGGRFDAAWREEYSRLSDYTRQRYSLSWEMPEPMRRLVSRDVVNGVRAAVQGAPALKKITGGLRRKNNLPSMHRWVVDDLTGTIECVLETESGVSLILPQIIAVMDSASRYFVGWSIGPIKAPTAELVCEGVLDGFQRHGVPKYLHLEDGFVFGKSSNVNGKEDEWGNTVVAGLRSYGCVIRRLGKRNPQAKGELEKSFDLLQRFFERHPGYTGRIQMFEASDTFKREQRLIRAGKIDGKTKRYTYGELSAIVLPKIFQRYNNDPRRSLGGRSPAQEFERRKDANCAPITFTPEIHWLLANERYEVPVRAGGVRISHFGRKLRVSGDELTPFIGETLRAVVSRRDDSMVSFMTKDFKPLFTMSVREDVDLDESATAPAAGVLAAERQKDAEHAKALRSERDRLLGAFGSPSEQLLNSVRQETQHTNIIDVNPQLAVAGAEMNRQREEIRARKEAEAKDRQRTKRIASAAGVHPAAVHDPEALRRITELLNDD